MGGTTAASDEIRVPMHELSSNDQRGRIAWWTADEAAKAKVTAGPDTSSFGISDPLFNARLNILTIFPILHPFSKIAAVGIREGALT